MRISIFVGLALACGCATSVPAAVSHDTQDNWRGIKGTARVQTLVQGGNAWVGTLVLEPEAEVPLHSDPTEEYIVVTEGGGTLWINGEQHILVRGSAAFMPAGAKVRFRNGARPTKVLQLFAGPRSATKYERWKPLKGQ